MNALVFLSVAFACGYLVWRGSHRFWHSVFAGIAVPLIGLIAFGIVIGRESLEGLSPFYVLFGTLLAIVVLAFICRRG